MITIGGVPSISEAQLYIGSILNVWCEVNTIMDNVLVTIRWNSLQYVQNGNLNASLTFNPLRKQDNHSYVCNAYVRPAPGHGIQTQLITHGMNLKTLNVMLVGKG